MANETVDGITIQVIVKGRVRGPDGSKVDVDIDRTWKFEDGTGSYEIGAIWQDRERTLNGSETLDLDALSDFKGATMSDNNRVKFGLFHNKSTTPGQTLTIGGGDWVGPFADASDKLVIGPDGLALIINPIDGYAVTASTGDGALVATSASLDYQPLLGFDNT